jgi:hypothetical protein
MNETLKIVLTSLGCAVFMVSIITAAISGMFKIADGGTKNKTIGFFLVILSMTALISVCALTEKHKQDSKKATETVVESKQ